MARAARGRFLAAEVKQAVDVFARNAIRTLKLAFDTLEARVTATEADITTAEGNITTLQTDLTAAEGDISTLQTDLDAVEAEVDVLQLHVGVPTLTLNDDQAAYMQFTASAARGLMLLGANTRAAGSAVVAFRVGASAFVHTLASVGATVTVGTGTLAGTTGTDTHLTIRADTATNRLYIENRTGATRDYGVIFPGMRIGEPASAWTIV
jgi:hypothetical protein